MFAFDFLLFTILGDEKRGQSVKYKLEHSLLPFIFFMLSFCCLICGRSFLELDLSYYFLRVETGPLIPVDVDSNLQTFKMLPVLNGYSVTFFLRNTGNFSSDD